MTTHRPTPILTTACQRCGGTAVRDDARQDRNGTYLEKRFQAATGLGWTVWSTWNSLHSP